MFAVKNLNIAYDDLFVVQDVSFSVSDGMLVAMVGPNGAGKSTLLKAIVGLVPRVSGVITLGDKPLSVAGGLVAYIPQHATMDWNFPITLADLVIMGCYGQFSFGRAPTCDKYAQVDEVLELVDLRLYKEQHIGVLSGGQRQRALLARALMQNAKLYLMDESLSGVDTLAQTIIMDILKNLSSKGKMVIIVHHHLAYIERYFDAVLLLNRSCLYYGPMCDFPSPSLLHTMYHAKTT